MKTLYTGGTFDVLHFGHLNFLKKCRLLAKNVIVSLNTDEFIKEFKGSSPIMTYAEREQSLNHCQYVDKVIPNLSGNDSKPSILQAAPDIIAVGDDWAHKDYYSQMQFTQSWLDDNNIALVYVPYTQGISTTEIKRRLNG